MNFEQIVNCVSGVTPQYTDSAMIMLGLEDGIESDFVNSKLPHIIDGVEQISKTEFHDTKKFAAFAQSKPYSYEQKAALENYINSTLQHVEDAFLARYQPTYDVITNHIRKTDFEPHFNLSWDPTTFKLNFDAVNALALYEVDTSNISITMTPVTLRLLKVVNLFAPVQFALDSSSSWIMDNCFDEMDDDVFCSLLDFAIANEDMPESPKDTLSKVVLETLNSIIEDYYCDFEEFKQGIINYADTKDARKSFDNVKVAPDISELSHLEQIKTELRSMKNKLSRTDRPLYDYLVLMTETLLTSCTFGIDHHAFTDDASSGELPLHAACLISLGLSDSELELVEHHYQYIMETGESSLQSLHIQHPQIVPMLVNSATSILLIAGLNHVVNASDISKL